MLAVDLPPETAASSSVEATPPAMLAPAWLCTSVTIPARAFEDAEAVIAAVVVLPLVAEITAEPEEAAARRGEAPAIACGHRAGSAPCRGEARAAPAARSDAAEHRATARAAVAIFASSSGGPHRRHDHVDCVPVARGRCSRQLLAIGSPSAEHGVKGRSALIAHLGRREHHVDGRAGVDVGAQLEHAWAAARSGIKAALTCADDRDDVEQAVHVEARRPGRRNIPPP